MFNALQINPLDNVAVVTKKIKKGELICFDGADKFEAIEDIEIYHKVATKDIKKDTFIVKYKEHIGKASCHIKRGEHVHSHNVLDYREELKD